MVQLKGLNFYVYFSIALAGLVWGCSTLQPSSPSPSPQASVSSATATPSTAASATPAQTPSPDASRSPSPAATPSPKAQAPNSTIPLTVEKMKNAEYYLLAKGPIKLTNGQYVDSSNKRTFKLDDVWLYQDMDGDGIKDAIASVTVTIPNQGNHSYIAVSVNEQGQPKNILAEYLGAEIRVKQVTAKPDKKIEVRMEQYLPGDPACCPSREFARTYGIKKDQPSPTPAKPNAK